MQKFPCLDAGCDAECCKQQILLPVSIYDIFNAAEYKKMKPQAFFDNYCGTATQGDLAYFVIDCTEKPCLFLKNNKCMIYANRPVICRTTLECENVRARYGTLDNYKKVAPDGCYIQKLNKIPEKTREKLEKRVDLEIAAIPTVKYAKKTRTFEEKTAGKVYEQIKRRMKSPWLRKWVAIKLKAEDKFYEVLWAAHIFLKRKT